MFKQGILENGLFHHKVDGYKEVSICYNKILIILMCVVCFTFKIPTHFFFFLITLMFNCIIKLLGE